MKKDDLTSVKHIGPARLKQLHKNGITTIEQLRKTPVRELARIKSIGGYYAIRIKEALAALDTRQTAVAPEPAAQSTEKTAGLSQDTKKSLKKLTRRLNSAREKLKPLWKKKYLALYIDFKKQSNKAIRRIKKIEKKQGLLTDQEMEKIINRSDALRQRLKTGARKPKKKTFKKLTREIKSFSTKLKAPKA